MAKNNKIKIKKCKRYFQGRRKGKLFSEKDKWLPASSLLCPKSILVCQFTHLGYLCMYFFPPLSMLCLYRSPDIVKVIKSRSLRWAGNVARMEEGRSVLKIVTGKLTGKRTLGRRWWEDNIRMDLKEMGVSTRNWINSADSNYRRALVNASLNLRIL